VPSLLWALLGDSVEQGLAGLLLFDLFAYAWLAPIARVIQDAAAPNNRALAFALCGGVGILFSLGVGIPLTGWISDLLAPDYGPRAIGYALAIMITAAAATGIFGLLRELRSDQRRLHVRV
jgi:MFS family permease